MTDDQIQENRKLWMVSSISNIGDNQSKVAQIRYKNLNNKNVKCHMLNGSALAIPRLMLTLDFYK